MKENSKIKILASLYTSFFKVGIMTFGGGLAMLPMLEREIVTKRKWCTNEEILDMYAIGQCTPGIIAVNTATFVGVKKAGVIGGIVATLGMVSPSLVIICLIASILSQITTIQVVQHALSGIRLAVCALMITTVVKLVKSGVKDKFGIIVCVLSFVLAVFTPVSTVIIIIFATIAGIIVSEISGKGKTKK